MQSQSGSPHLFAKATRFLFKIVLAILIVLAGALIAYRFVPPISTLMLARWAFGETVDRAYVPLEHISATLQKAIIVSEDARFCRHDGVDWGALRGVIDSSDSDGPKRGASTITMQTAKNLFLWPGRSYLRKAIEVPLALLLDLVWPKRRILEIYLNVAEWGEGLYGAEAAAQRYFAKSADRLDEREAALLATALPSPARRNAARPTRLHVALARKLISRIAATDPALFACLR
jgi:monofunctional biosynthetic peptidoglycan transglycosylase